MPKSSTPRKAYTPRNRHAMIDPWTRTLRPSEKKRVLAPFIDTLQAMREGRGTEADMATINTMDMLLDAGEKSRIIAGTKPILSTARTACSIICDRAVLAPGEWQPTTLRSNELQALNELLSAFTDMLDLISNKQYAAILSRYMGWVGSQKLQIAEKRKEH